ncbi:helix-turn-helix domain-containing protein [Flammeovirga kamogawensis]|uniref:Helix-turn-helix transcriptional regulator n=1 Tax=Flammeovirga kamogawensis TaxID=373891 RepID=A0ABX8H1L2_9BACT|nr:AraC family transcriptional regulator [Flammeovirga kamogawensis]MBB6462406.1 AraC-like DNA-binding protein [Flammeovirga kamogawensis]QWG09518.1 helix-turn-helix transcriptional regulator [Flammeovirga kamogawensis]TRX65034.1 helix-turn-helix transcriptional regulator [Flammeovirga kamogawensis]
MEKTDFDISLKAWADIFKAKVVNNRVDFNNAIGIGSIDGYKCSDQLEVFRFQFKLHEVLEIERKKKDEEYEFIPVFFGDPADESVLINSDDDEEGKKYTYNSKGAFCSNTLGLANWKYPKNKDLKVISIRIKLDYFKYFVSQSENLQKVFNPNQTFLIFEEFDPRMRELFTQIFELKRDEIFENEHIEVYAQNMVLTYFKNISKRKELLENNKYPFNVEPVFKARSILKSTLNKPVSIDYLTVECGLSESRLRFLFKKIFGATIHQYHQDVRLDKSRMLLREGKKTMSMIALDLGFSSSSHFTLAFKKKYSITPKDFKKEQMLY